MTTAVPLSDLAAALRVALQVPAVTAGPDGVAVWVGDQLPENPAYPAVTITVRGKPVGPLAASTVWECEAEIDVYTRYRGDREAQQIGAAIAALLDNQRPTVAGWSVPVLSLQDMYPIADELVNGGPVTRWTLPFLARLVKA